MASNGLLNRAKKGICHICQRGRCTLKHVKIVGEVRHGMATGHIWECFDANECEKAAKERLAKDISGIVKDKIKTGLKQGRYTEYVIRN